MPLPEKLRAIRRQQRAPHEVLFLLRDLPARSTPHIRPDLLEEIIAQVENEIAGQWSRYRTSISQVTGASHAARGDGAPLWSALLSR